MMRSEKGFLHLSNMRRGILRMVVVILLIVVQLWWIVFLVMRLEWRAPWVATLITYASVAMILFVNGRNLNSAYKLVWIVTIAAFPILGSCLYLLGGRSRSRNRLVRRFAAIEEEFVGYATQDDVVLGGLEAYDNMSVGQSRYLANHAHAPVWSNNEVVYFDDAAKGLQAQLEALRNAREFIFMEYLTIEDDVAFAEVKEILKKKAAEGVIVRVIYDDVGSVVFLNKNFVREMEAAGVACRVFNPMAPVLNIFMNNRDHRKITVVDGQIGFTGGYNFAGEYFHLSEPYGYWKDSGISLTGDAVRNLTLSFLTMWNAIEHTDRSLESFFPPKREKHGGGFVQPFADSPLDHERVGEEVYMNVLRCAREYVWFVTPYLVLSNEMEREFTSAAKRGLDVRIITPGIPDKKLTWQVTRSYYDVLTEAGVSIYEYTPGFCHAKMCLADNRIAVVGTINLDFRSLYLHFENGVLLLWCDAISEIKRDFIRMFEVSRKISQKELMNRNRGTRVLQFFLRLFAPLL